MPSWWNKKPIVEEKPVENEVDEDKYASPWARARAKEAAEKEAAALEEEKEATSLQEMPDDEWLDLMRSKMTMFFDDNQMRSAGEQETFNSFPDFLFQNKDGRAIWDEHQRRLGIDPDYLKPTGAIDEETDENPVVQE